MSGHICRNDQTKRMAMPPPFAGEQDIPMFPNLTIGPEFEAVVHYKEYNNPQVSLASFKRQNPGVIIVPPWRSENDYPLPRDLPEEVKRVPRRWNEWWGGVEYQHWHDEYLEGYCLNYIRRLLRSQGIDVLIPGSTPLSIDPTQRNAANTDNPEYYRWTVKLDTTVDLAEDEWVLGRRLRVLNLEVVGPSMVANQASLDEILRVLGILKRLACLVPQSTGFHIHVGVGRARFDVVQLRQNAAVWLALDPLFTLFHTDIRQDNSQCERNRLQANVARGETAATANRNPNNDELVTGKWGERPSEQPAPIRACVNELLACTDVRAVAWLMRCPNRGAVNFRFYGPATNRNQMNMTGSPISKPTIEMRQAAGTLNEDWVSAYIKVVVGTVDWARRQNPDAIRALATSMEELEGAGRNKVADPITFHNLYRKYARRFVEEYLGLKAEMDYILGRTPEQRARPTGILNYAPPGGVPLLMSSRMIQSERAAQEAEIAAGGRLSRSGWRGQRHSLGQGGYYPHDQ
ncbi:uncharacterized protein BCR38DRAFT_413612 [Pseudomassariella vexata]|uniref:Amidoligase enzyme-domain-containing protein n=1 Tax=Pseudomassariella vexata TaxID=1141098 RepID=A0A1Y2DG63_9PEZI|nr:uncharacterized protein BCR38DRAFT_413612 [Pseudomassariella vexata]ORY58219.1 hypothetical protein BCR38DRAFT_413612 [Pseudomassariella vexata]